MISQRGAFVSEPAIMVKRPGRSGQVWSMEKLDNKLVDMRDMYDDWRRRQQRADDNVEEVRTTSETVSLNGVGALTYGVTGLVIGTYLFI